jgi:hypothetical protein
MTLPQTTIRRISRDIGKALDSRGMSISEVSRLCAISQSQASRICAGKFKTVSEQVMRICMKLGIDPFADVGSAAEMATANAVAEAARQKVLLGALALWDGSAEGAENLSAIFKRIAILRDLHAARRKRKQS